MPQAVSLPPVNVAQSSDGRKIKHQLRQKQQKRTKNKSAQNYAQNFTLPTAQQIDIMPGQRQTTSAKLASSEQVAIPTASTTITTLGQQQLDAVIIRDLTYQVGRGSGRKVILNGINLTVPEGSIYGLLGPSGCGKTTMLRCIVGRTWPKSGSVLVFGLKPGGGQGEVPGRDVGYMPQDISIYEDFTIEETLRYFGKINRLHSDEIKNRIEFLLQFLDLPSKKRLVTNLSGGQKRRVSLAAALVHSPPLLILDEPTVGVDPLLRQNIWRHLVAMTKHDKISVIITTHYIEEARLANVVGLMRNGRILAEASPDDLMLEHQTNSLEEVFLKLCVNDSARAHQWHRQSSSSSSSQRRRNNNATRSTATTLTSRDSKQITFNDNNGQHKRSSALNFSSSDNDDDDGLERDQSNGQARRRANKINNQTIVKIKHDNDRAQIKPIRIHTGTNKIELLQIDHHAKQTTSYTNETVEVFSSEDESSTSRRSSNENLSSGQDSFDGQAMTLSEQEDEHARVMTAAAAAVANHGQVSLLNGTTSGVGALASLSVASDYEHEQANYLAIQQMHWTARRANAISLARFKSSTRERGPYNGLDGRRTRSHKSARSFAAITNNSQSGGIVQWCKTLSAVTWKNYIRLRRNPPVLVFQFMLPAIQVILFCLCIGGEPFDVPVAIVNEEQVPKSSLTFLNGLNKKIIRQIKYDNLTSAIDAVRKGHVWGALHIPDKYSENLQSRLIMGEDVTNDTISNGTIRVYPDLTNLHLAMTLESTFRETFLKFARDSIEEMGYDRSLADLPIKVGRPIYGTMKKDGYLEFMAPGVVISISYVMATGLTALAFILERRDGLLERSLVSGVQTSQILLAHAINQVFVMIIQIFLVLGCTFFIFEIPSRGPFFWVVLLILLQGCTGMGFGLLVSAICAEENTAVMMVVGTFYTNLILAGIIWPIEAMPHWLRPVSYSQPQTLPTESLRHILSRGWGITETGVLLGFAVTIGWLFVFLMAAGIIFKYSR